MASVNRVILIGNLGKDPESRFLPSGVQVASCSVATTEKWKDKSGAVQEHTEWTRCSMFGKTAELAVAYLKKGSSVYLEGKLHTNKWQDKEGQDRYSTEVRVDRMQLLGGKGAKPEGDYAAGSGRSAAARANPDAGKKGAGAFESMDDEIPY